MTTFHDDERDAITPAHLRNAPSPAINSAPLTIDIRTGITSERPGGMINTGNPDFTADLASDPYERMIATATNEYGSPIGYRRPLKDTDLVTVEGMTTSVKVAKTMGLLQQEAVGTINPSRPAIDQLNDDPFNADDYAPDLAEALPANHEAALGELISATHPSDQVAVLSDVVKNGEPSEDAIDRIASQMGIEPGEASEKVTEVISYFQAQADDAIKRMGIDDPWEFYGWAQANIGTELQKAMMRHGLERTTSGYVPLVEKFKAERGRSNPDAVLAADHGPGVEVFKRGDKVMVRVNGMELEHKVAVRTGLIKG